MLRVVLDTNVVVSALLRPKGAPAAILDSATSRQFRCFVSESLLEEYSEVIARDYLGLDQHRTARFMKDLRKIAMLVVPREKLVIARDPDDNQVMECAIEAEADFVVTGNVRDFPLQFHGVRVVTPRDFLVVLGSSPRPF
ncbi:MAG: putative toxin-antitoxin system toxin component, PIN family [Candidatus Acidiferrales bacterium]